MDSVNVLNIPINKGSYSEFKARLIKSAQEKKGDYACLANVHMLVEAHNNKRFAKVIKHADYVAPDGKPLAWAMKLLYNIKQERVAGMDLLPDLITGAAENGLSVFFYGGTEDLLNKTAAYLRASYPGLAIAGMHSPPFRQLTALEEKKVAEKINASGADFVFVVLGCPKQEKWMASMKGRVHATMVGVGGALPVMIGAQSRAPRWMQKAGLEWFFRLLQEPKRLLKRYTVTSFVFLFLLTKAFISQRLFHKAA